MIKFLICLISFSGFFFVFCSLISATLRSFVKSSEVDQEPDDKFEVREEWRDFL